MHYLHTDSNSVIALGCHLGTCTSPSHSIKMSINVLPRWDAVPVVYVFSSEILTYNKTTPTLQDQAKMTFD